MNSSDSTDLNELKDEELVELAQSGSEDAINILLERYRPLILSLSSRYFLRGQDRDDLIQEASIAVLRAIDKFDPKQNSNFAGFVKLVGTQDMIDAIRKSENLNNQVLSDAISTDANDLEFSAVTLTGQTIDTEEELISRIEYFEQKKLKDVLSPLEWDVFIGRLSGKSYQEIANDLFRSVKAIDNALQRIKKKLRNSSDSDNI